MSSIEQARRQPGQPDTGHQEIDLRGYNPLQAYFLSRLQSLVRRRKEYADSEKPEHWLLRAFNRVTYSTYMDCMSLGVGTEARALLERETTSC